MRIAHTLYLDIIGWSKESLDEQGRLIRAMNEAVHATEVYSHAVQDGAALPIPAGDGMALVFREDVTAPARCALEISRALAGAIPLRMGIHSGLVKAETDIAGKENVVGEGINTAKRVMDEGDAGHILLSEQHAHWLRQSEQWRDLIFPWGERAAKHGLQLALYALVAEGVGRRDVPERPATENAVVADAAPLPNIVLLCRRGGAREEDILRYIETRLTEQGFAVYRDRNRHFRPGWAEEMRERIQGADAVLAVVSPESRRSEMLPWELEQAREGFDANGRPIILPLLVGTQEEAQDDIEGYLQDLTRFVWESPDDSPRIVAEIVSAIRGPLPASGSVRLEPVGGAVPLESEFYITRKCDADLMAALDARESILLIAGPRQVGKTSLLARAAQHARDNGARVIQTDFQQLNASYLADEQRFYRSLATTVARQQGFAYNFATEWDEFLAPNENLNFFMETLASSNDAPLVWCLDEADKLFPAPFASDFFGLVRSWHNARANRPDGPWKRLTLIIGYATEARLFIRDLNQSPFNVGRKLELNDFDLDQFRALNHRYSDPLSLSETTQVYDLLAGQPFLSRKALDAVATGSWTCPALLADALRDDGPFHDHLQRLMLGVMELPEVTAFVRQVLAGTATASADTTTFDRVHSAGLVRQDRNGVIDFRCSLYRRYLSEHL